MHTPRLIVGIGNAGSKYENTYHNAGLLFIDACAGKDGWREIKSRHFSYKKEPELVFAKPLSFMNESGRGTHTALSYFGMDPHELLVVHDDADLPLGTARLSYGRGAGGHHGIESIVTNLRTNGFWRLRIGIRHDYAREREKAGSFVLRTISEEHWKIFAKLHSYLIPNVIRNSAFWLTRVTSAERSVTFEN